MPERVDMNAVPRRTYAQDEQIVGDVGLVDSDVNNLSITFDRAIMGDVFFDMPAGEFTVEVSYDNEVTWRSFGGIGFAGGEMRRFHGSIAPWSQWNVDIDPEVGGVQRKYRVMFTARRPIDVKIDCDLLVRNNT